MRILFDSQLTAHKTPFGTLIPGQECRLTIHVPTDVGAIMAECIIDLDDGTKSSAILLEKAGAKGAYTVFSGSFSLDRPGLYFYYFRIYKPTGSFRLFKQGHDTNMEAGDRWQLTCVPEHFTTPDWAKGAVIYQVFPDRFYKAGSPDITGKLTPYTVHEDWYEDVQWQPDKYGNVLNNDFFGGNFRGIAEKMDYIASFGTTILYLNPISKSFSNHRYDTADYKTPDPMLGTEQDFKAMCDAAHQRGIKVILDGVYSHTGVDSIYFQSACSSPLSPYYSWYTFYAYPNRYNCWWGFDTLPTVNKEDAGFVDYIIEREDSVVAHWLALGADGFRLDVADELPDSFIRKLKNRIRQIKPDALLMGEVWEDASNKIAYGIRRRYFVDGELDSCMNYPFRTAIVNFLKDFDDGSGLKETVMTLAENYPPQVLACNMNLLGSHDTPRVLTALMDDFAGSREEYSIRTLSPTQRQQARQMLFMASFLQYTLPGSPSIYYGDEAGMEGHKDPFNRRPFPWGSADTGLQHHFRALGILKKNYPALRLGDIAFFCHTDGLLGFSRTYDNQALKIYVNRSDQPWDIPTQGVLFAHRLTDRLAPMGFCITEEETWNRNDFSAATAALLTRAEQ